MERQKAESLKVAEAKAHAERLTKVAEEQAARTKVLADEQVGTGTVKNEFSERKQK